MSSNKAGVNFSAVPFSERGVINLARLMLFVFFSIVGSKYVTMSDFRTFASNI